MIEEKTFRVEGMGDEDGEELVERALRTIDGVESAVADSFMDVVVVRYDPAQATVDDMVQVVDMCGYDLEV